MRTGCLLLALLTAVPALADDAARKVTDCMRANVPPQLTIGDLELTVFDRVGGSRTLRGRLFMGKSGEAGQGLRKLRATLRIDGPAEYKGAAYLVTETEDYLRDGMFVYLPTVKRVRRITGTFADGSLMGTNFSYFDFKQLQNAFGDLAGTLEGAETVNERPAHVLTFKALPELETRYTAVRAWVDREACVVLRADFYEGRKAAKHLTTLPGALKRAGRVWYLSEMEMRDAVSGSRTLLRLGKLDAERAVPARLFDPTSFHLGP